MEFTNFEYANVEYTFSTVQSNLQHECQTRATRMRHKQHECNTSETHMTRMRHKCDMSVTRVKNVDFDNDASKNIFSHPYIYYMTSERLQRDEQLHSITYLLEMPCSHTKMRLKSSPQKLNFLMAKDVSKGYTLDCSCTLMPLRVLAQLRIVKQPHF